MGETWRLAKSLEVLRAQINSAAPKRSREWDGSIGDTAHSARASDHNPDDDGVVNAIDITNDPKGGCSAEQIAESLRAAKDERVKYVIWNHRMFRSYPKPGIPAWSWAQYTGASPHDHHVHVSVGALGDKTMPWNVKVASS